MWDSTTTLSRDSAVASAFSVQYHPEAAAGRTTPTTSLRPVVLAHLVRDNKDSKHCLSATT